MLSEAGREIDGLFEDGHGLTTDHLNEEEVNPMLAYAGRSKMNGNKTGKMATRPSSKKSLNDLHQTAAMLVRETRGAGLKVEVEKPRSLALFLQELTVSKPEIATPGKKKAPNVAHIETKSWSRMLGKEELLLLAKQKPKLSSGADFTSSDQQVNLTILSTGVPGGTQREVDHRRSRQQIAPKVKKASIDLLNDRLDTRIAMQKKAQALQQRFNAGDDEDDDGDEPQYSMREYETFKEASKGMEELEEVDAEGSSSTSDEEEAHIEEADPGVMEAPEWKTRGMAYELGRPRRPIIADDEEDENDKGGNVTEDISQSDDSEDEEVLGALNHTSDIEGDIEANVDESMAKELRQTDLSRFLSGAFSKPPTVAIANSTKPTMGKKTHKKISEKEKRVRSAFFEEEAEDEDEEELPDDEAMDEAAIEAELAQSKFIEEEADANAYEGEEDGVHHLDVHRALMKADDDRALDQVLMKFARDKTLHGPASLARLDSKYNQPEESEDDGGADGPAVVRDMSKRRDAALFKLIEGERSDGDDFDLDDEQSLSEDGLEYPLENQEDDVAEEEEEEEGEEEEVESMPQERLEDSLASLFSHSAHPSTYQHCGLPTTTKKRAMGTLDAERKARLLAQDEDEEKTTTTSKGGAFKKIKK